MATQRLTLSISRPTRFSAQTFPHPFGHQKLHTSIESSIKSSQVSINWIYLLSPRGWKISSFTHVFPNQKPPGNIQKPPENLQEISRKPPENLQEISRKPPETSMTPADLTSSIKGEPQGWRATQVRVHPHGEAAPRHRICRNPGA